MVNMNEYCGRCGCRRGDHFGEPDDSCYGEKNELFYSCNPKAYSKEVKK